MSLAGRLDGAGVELGHQLNALAGQQAAQIPVADRLGERAIQRRDIGQLNTVPDPPPVEVVIGEEAELQRSDRALDRHVDHVDHQPATAEPRQRGVQGDGALGRIEGENVPQPLRAGQPVGLLRQQPRARGDHEHVVAQFRAVIEVHAVGGHIDTADSGLVKRDAGAELLAPRADDPPHVGEPERTNSNPGWYACSVSRSTTMISAASSS